VLISRADYDALEETAPLLRSPANARRLLGSLAQAQRGEREEHRNIVPPGSAKNTASSTSSTATTS
jgi:hypothetical protein